jgi:hypothetical protein
MSNITSQIVHLALDAYGDRLASVRGHVSNGDELDAMRAALEVAEAAWTKATPEHQTDMLRARMVLNQVVVPGAQPVEAVDGTALRWSELSLTVRLNDDDCSPIVFLGDEKVGYTMACVVAAVNEMKAALLDPRPTGHAKVLTTQSILNRIEAVARQADSAMHSSDERHLRNTLEIVADDLTAIIAAERVHAPTGEQAGEVEWPKKMQDRADGSHVYGSGYKAALKDASDHLAAQARPVGVPDNDNCAGDDYFGKKLPALRVDHQGREFEVRIVLHRGRHYVNRIFQLVSPARGYHSIRREVWPKAKVGPLLSELMGRLGMDQRGLLADYDKAMLAAAPEVSS